MLEMNPENAGAMNYLGYMLADRDVRLDEAYQLIKKAIDQDPNNGAYLDSLGWVYFRQGKLNEAEGVLVRALDRIGQRRHGPRSPGRRLLQAREDAGSRSRSGRRR